MTCTAPLAGVGEGGADLLVPIARICPCRGSLPHGGCHGWWKSNLVGGRFPPGRQAPGAHHFDSTPAVVVVVNTYWLRMVRCGADQIS